MLDCFLLFFSIEDNYDYLDCFWIDLLFNSIHIILFFISWKLTPAWLFNYCSKSSRSFDQVIVESISMIKVIFRIYYSPFVSLQSDRLNMLNMSFFIVDPVCISFFLQNSRRLQNLSFEGRKVILNLHVPFIELYIVLLDNIDHFRNSFKSLIRMTNLATLKIPNSSSILCKIFR